MYNNLSQSTCKHPHPELSIAFPEATKKTIIVKLLELTIEQHGFEKNKQLSISFGCYTPTSHNSSNFEKDSLVYNVLETRMKGLLGQTRLLLSPIDSL